MKQKWIMIVAVLLVLSFAVSCAGRTPTAKSAQSIGTHYFQSYGKKFPFSDFGHKNIDRVMINGVEEVSFRMALVDAVVQHVDGHASHVLMKMEKKFPGGWCVISWEMAGQR
ncbi:MAG TPA: hypothetical protein VJC18_01610 [bacterium]|nr:hypothetical protein [bacterium]